MKLLFTIFLLPLFIGVQSMATVCAAKCNISGLGYEDSQIQEAQKSPLPSCHQAQQEKEEDSSDQKKDCELKICEVDGVIKSEISQITPGSSLVSFLLIEFGEFISVPLEYFNSLNYGNAPPGISFYSNIPIFIQKSSYLI